MKTTMLVIALALARARVAGADPLAAHIHGAAEEARARRVGTLTGGAIAGAGFVPIGVVLEGRRDPVGHATGIGLIFGGALPVAFSTLSLSPSTVERFAARFDAGMDPADASREWRALAEASHAQRLRQGVIVTVFGLAAVAVGIGLLRRDDVTAGSVLVGAGVPFLQLGMRGLIQRTPEEIWSEDP